MEEPVLGVIGEAEDEVPDEAAERKQQHPPRPVYRVGLDHAVNDQQQPKSRVRERRGKRRRVRQAANRACVEERADD